MGDRTHEGRHDGPDDRPQDADRLQDHLVVEVVDEPGTGPAQEVSDDPPEGSSAA